MFSTVHNRDPFIAFISGTNIFLLIKPGPLYSSSSLRIHLPTFQKRYPCFWISFTKLASLILRWPYTCLYPLLKKKKNTKKKLHNSFSSIYIIQVLLKTQCGTPCSSNKHLLLLEGWSILKIPRDHTLKILPNSSVHHSKVLSHYFVHISLTPVGSL